MKITRQEFVNAYQNAQKLMMDKPDKLAYSCKRFVEKTKHIRKEISRYIDDLNNKYCSTDKDGNVLKRIVTLNGSEIESYVFTKEAEKQLACDIELYLEESITLTEEHVHICQDNSRVAKLHHSFEILNGLVFDYDFWAEAEKRGE